MHQQSTGRLSVGQ